MSYLDQSGNNPNIGDDAVYTITAYNNGPDDASNIIISDISPKGLIGLAVVASPGTSFNQATGIWTITSLASGETATLTITGKVPSNGIFTNIINQIGQTEYNPDLTYNSQKKEIIVSAVDIRVQQYPWYYNADTNTYQYQYQNSNTPVFTVDIRNNGPDDATGVVIDYKIGNGLKYQGYSTSIGTVTYANNELIWNIGFMPNGGKATMKVFTTILESGTNTQT